MKNLVLCLQVLAKLTKRMMSVLRSCDSGERNRRSPRDHLLLSIVGRAARTAIQLHKLPGCSVTDDAKVPLPRISRQQWRKA